MMTMKQRVEEARVDLLKRIEAFLLEHDMGAATFGRLAAGDSALVFELREGRRPGPELMDSLTLFMRAYHRPSQRARAGNAEVAA